MLVAEVVEGEILVVRVTTTNPGPVDDGELMVDVIIVTRVDGEGELEVVDVAELLLEL